MALLALTLPLGAAVLSTLLACTRFARFAHLPAILGFAASAATAGILLGSLVGMESNEHVISLKSDPVTWFAAGNLNVNFTITVDPLSAIMLATVTFVATWIAVFSAGYMHRDPGYGRYFAIMGLFVFAMCLLVLANNFLVLLAGWEGVGLCSYLLVGYYYAKPSSAAAARKAFLVTRIGDVGMIFGIFLLWHIGGYHTDIDKLFEHIAKHPPAQSMLTTACLLLFCGAVGKSAQLPLYVWLPDAMEGPTPVSALIHAATMVTAGVYLLARCAPIFVTSETTQIIVCLTGGFTALVAAFTAVAQTDLKRVLAYSTVSQLGFMFMSLGTGGEAVAPSLAVTAAIFHLFTHAFFKALLFLGSGSVMHAMGNVIDMRRFGGLRKLMPVTHLTFLAGSAALAGVPLLSGFWSKDQIIDNLFETTQHANAPAVYWFAFGIALVTAGLTAFYTFRAYFLTFWGPERLPPEAGDHAHESPWVMLVPLIVLAIGAVAIGLVVEPLTHGFSEFLARTPGLTQANEHTKHAAIEHPHFNWAIAGVSSVIALSGIGIAALLYRKGGPEVVPASLRGVHELSRNKLYVDEIYGAAIVQPSELLAAASRQFDALLDGVARLVSFLPRLLGAVLRALQTGQVQFYALGMTFGLAAFLIVLLVRSTR